MIPSFYKSALSAGLFLTIGGVVYGAAYSDAVLADSPVAYWRLNETSVGTVTDSAGSNDGTHNGFVVTQLGVPGAIAGESDTATDFDGVGSFIQGALDATTFDGSWTIETWFRHDAVTSWGGLFSNNVSPEGTSAPLLTMVDTTNLFGINDAGVSAANISVDLGAGHFGKWLYGAITYTEGTNLFDVYVYGNGVDPLSATPQHAQGPAYWTLNENSNNFLIGRHWTSAVQIWDGQLDEMAVYKDALSQSQLENHFITGITVPEPASLGFLLIGGAAILGRRRRRKA